MDKLDILLVDSNPKVATAFRLAIKDTEPRHVLSVASSFAEIALLLKKKKFDLFVFSFNYIDTNGLEDIPQFIERYGSAPILAILPTAMEQQTANAFGKGASEVIFEGNLMQPLMLKALYCTMERYKVKQKLADYASRYNLSEKRFADVQQLSGIGHIELDLLTGEMNWSDEVFRILEVQLGSNMPTLKDFLHVVQSEDRAVLEATIERTSADGQVHECEICVFVKSNKVKYLNCLVKLIFNEYKQKYNIVITVKDVTQAKLLEEQAFEAKLDVLNNQLLENLLSDLAGRVRRPLSSVLNFAYLLKQKQPSDSGQEAIDGLALSVNELSESINNLLNFTIVRGGKIEPLRQKLNVEAFLEDLTQFCALQASTKGIAFSATNELHCPEGLVGDLRLMSQLLYNFMLYSISHAKPGSAVDLKIEWVLVHPLRKLITFTLRDEAATYHLGPEKIRDLADIEITDILELEQNPDFQLIIVLKILKLLGGNLSYTRKSKSNYLMLKIELDIVNHEKPSVEPSVNQETLRILIAEDHSMNQLALKKLLSNWKPSAQIVLADNGQQALALARDQDFDLILMDLQMPVLDGFDAFEAISAIKPIPTIALSASSNDGERVKCTAAGFKAYIEKPYKPEQLFSLIESVLSPA